MSKEEKNNELENAKDCYLCGMCKSSCPVYEILLNERYSPRGKAILLKANEEDKTFYLCTLCGNCITKCPAKVDLKLREHRQKLVKQLTTKANKKMIENLRRHGNPYGDVKNLKQGETPESVFF